MSDPTTVVADVLARATVETDLTAHARRIVTALDAAGLLMPDLDGVSIEAGVLGRVCVMLPCGCEAVTVGPDLAALVAAARDHTCHDCRSAYAWDAAEEATWEPVRRQDCDCGACLVCALERRTR